jgi:hypothetical protein
MMLEQRETAEHSIRDVVGKENAIPATRLVVEEGVELDDALHLRRGNVESFRDRAGGVGRDPIQFFLNLA